MKKNEFVKRVINEYCGMSGDVIDTDHPEYHKIVDIVQSMYAKNKTISDTVEKIDAFMGGY